MVEVNARDRPGLLARLAHVIHAAGHQLHSAHIATYGERAVDVFYLTRCRREEADGDQKSTSFAQCASEAAIAAQAVAAIRKGPAVSGEALP